MNDQISYVFITPTALRKGRAGGILSRLISRSGLELYTGRIFAPSIKTLHDLSGTFKKNEKTVDYLKKIVAGSHALVLVVKGEDATSKVSSIVGDDYSMMGRGETLRDSYGDLVEENGRISYFEPGVIAPSNNEEVSAGLNILVSASDTEGGIMDASSSFSTLTEKTLVLIKPDNFLYPNIRPGAIIGLFARTGLALVGFKPFNFSIAQAEEFYRPVLDVLIKNLPDGQAQWESIIAFMAGKKPSQCAPNEKMIPGTQRCVALIYQGPDAIAKIRVALGATNPAQALHGTVRKEFGTTVMVNSAHASDSAENVIRETDIIHIHENDFKIKITSIV